jgi:hypothetical protein
MRKKTNNLIFPLLVMGVFLVFASSCKKDDVPVLTTLAVTEITQTTAKSGGNITSDGGATITACGVCWSTGQTPTISDNKTTDGTGAGIFESNIVGLSANTTYYVRAYATNSNGTVYGNEISFTTGLSIGSFYAGGIVFYNDGTGHGLVCAESDQSIGEGWGCALTFIGGTSTAINTGAANTNVIVAGCTQAGIAAKLCYDLSLNGYTDWYLPSRDELVLMNTNLHLQGLGNFADYYWSSSELSDYPQDYAWGFNFYDGGAYYNNKFGDFRVRAVRAF